MNQSSHARQSLTTPAAVLGKIPPAAVQLALRGGLAGILWSSARTKVEGPPTLSDSSYYLFEEEYRLPLLDPEFAAHLATYAEHLLPVMLLLAIGTRFAALGLFIMTLVIQLFVYPDAFLSTHLGWFALALGIMAYGPGTISLDSALARKS